MSDAFYQAREGLFVATPHTRGPWSPDFQHGGPPAALIARAAETVLGGDARIARLSVDFLRPIPIAELELKSERTRDGRVLRSAEVELTSSGKVIARARASAIVTRDVRAAVEDKRPLPGAESCKPFTLAFKLADVGYHTAMDARLASGEPGSGHVTVWMRALIPLLADEPISPLQRVMIAADSGNGVSARLDPTRFTFLNADLSVCLHRYPVGEWVAIDAHTNVGDGGVGLTTTHLHDASGAIGNASQPLVVANV